MKSDTNNDLNIMIINSQSLSKLLSLKHLPVAMLNNTQEQ